MLLKSALMATGAAAVAFALASGVQAQQGGSSAAPDRPMSGQGSAGKGHGMPMTGSQSQMDDMMANCRRMMQSMHDWGDQPKPGGDTPAPQERG